MRPHKQHSKPRSWTKKAFLRSRGRSDRNHQSEKTKEDEQPPPVHHPRPQPTENDVTVHPMLTSSVATVRLCPLALAEVDTSADEAGEFAETPLGGESGDAAAAATIGEADSVCLAGNGRCRPLADGVDFAATLVTPGVCPEAPQRPLSLSLTNVARPRQFPLPDVDDDSVPEVNCSDDVTGDGASFAVPVQLPDGMSTEQSVPPVNLPSTARRVPEPILPEMPADGPAALLSPGAAATGGIVQLVEELFSALYRPFSASVHRELVRQIRDLLVCRYLGNVTTFRRDFLLPAVDLLRDYDNRDKASMRKSCRHLIAEETDPSSIQSHQELLKGPPLSNCLRCTVWPLCLDRKRILVRFGELEPSQVKPGDYYLCVRPPPAQTPGAQLVLCYCHSGSGSVTGSDIRQHVIGHAHSCSLPVTTTTTTTMETASEDGSGDNPVITGTTEADSPLLSPFASDVQSDEQMTSMLQHMLVSVEKGIERMRWELRHSSLQWTTGRCDVPPGHGSAEETEGRETEDPSSSSSCCCHSPHGVKDSGVQTSPMAEPETSFGDRPLDGVVENGEHPVVQRSLSASSSLTETAVSSPVAVASVGTPTSGTDIATSGSVDAASGSQGPAAPLPVGGSEGIIARNFGGVSSGARNLKLWIMGAISGGGSSSASGSSATSPSAAPPADVAKLSSAAGRDSEEALEVTSTVGYCSGRWSARAGSMSVAVETDDGYHDNSFVAPSTVYDVNDDLLQSQAAIIPGCRDRTGRVVVVVDCSQLVRAPSTGCGDTALPATTRPLHLAQLLLYYHAVPRKELAARGLLILVDARKACNESFNFLDEAFCLLEGNSTGSINTVVVWRALLAASGTDTSPRKAPSPFRHSAVKFEMVHMIEEVNKIIKPDQLPVSLGGEYCYDHQQWVQFRKRLEPFMESCRAVGKKLISVMTEMKVGLAPASSVLTSTSIEQHKKFVGQVFDDPQLVQLQQTGPDVLRELEETRRRAPGNNDFRDSTERCSALYSELQRAIVKLVRLTDKRLRKLDQCLQLRTLEEETNQVLSWLSKKGEETLTKHQVVANSLGGVKAQERDFEKFYFLAMRHIDKGNDLLEEAAMLGQKGSGTDALGMKDLAKSLKQHLGTFSTRLEDQREKLEDTSKCYQLLDKAYEWALEAMKFVSRLKMDQFTSPEQLSCLMKHLHHYLENHPPLSEEVFAEMIVLATKLDNERLLEQCKVAQVRCRETAELIRTRQQTLLKAKQQIEVESLRSRQIHQEKLLDQVSEAMAARGTGSPNKLYQPTTPIWAPFATSTPCYPYTRRRSVAGLTYNVPASPRSYYGGGQVDRRSSDGGVSISEEPDDASSGGSGGSGGPHSGLERIPHADEDVTESSDAAPDKGSKGGGSGSAGSGGRSSSSVSSASSSSSGGAADAVGALSLSHAKKLMKRSQTWQFPDDSWDHHHHHHLHHGSRPLSHAGKNLPMRGSAESIPSIHENDDGSNASGGGGFPPVPVNTHLHQRGSSLNLQFPASSMADLRPSDEQIKRRKTVHLIMREMIQTERDYVKSLEYIIENYLPELLREDIPQALRGKRNVIFGNIEKIHEFHNRYFLPELEQCEPSPSQVGQSFLRHESHFYLYALYNKNKPNSDSLMAEYGSSFFKSKQIELNDKMDLASYLLKPVQRMGKYALLLKQLLKECSEKDPEYGAMTDAKEMVNFQLRHGNDLLAMDAIRECDVNLKEQGCLLRQDEFLVWQGKSRKCLRQVFLFEDLILFSKARRDPIKKGHDVYQYKCSIKTSDIGLTEQLGESNAKFEIWFRKRKVHDTYTCQAPNPEIRLAWIQEISKLLWKQALRNREMRLVEMSSMGIGNKPCLDIKPSQDQINDRSISINQLNKAPRFRNSIAVTSTDYLRNNKRPHSIISVSSSSSSGSSSHSSASSSVPPFYGALNLGFDPNDSPESRHRSVTQQSQCSSESGIMPDISLNYDSLTECSSESHQKVGRSNSNTSNESIGICSLPLSPPTTPATPEEDAGIGSEGQ